MAGKVGLMGNLFFLFDCYRPCLYILQAQVRLRDIAALFWGVLAPRSAFLLALSTAFLILSWDQAEGQKEKA